MRLIQIYEDEWLNHKAAVMAIILRAISKQSGRVMARKCKVLPVSPASAQMFLNLHHVQGWRPCTVSFGLEYQGELVAVMSFTRSTGRNGSVDFELSRYATAVSVAGGAGKLLAAFDAAFNKPRVVSYSDNRYFDGTMYRALGFKKTAERVDYEYLYKGVRRHKSFLQKRNLQKIMGDKYDVTLTERELTAILGAKRILNAGRVTHLRG